MKRLLAITALFIAVSAVSVAQKSKVSSAYWELQEDKPDLKKAKAKIAEAEKDEKTSVWARTYLVKSQVYTKLFEESMKKNEKTPDSKLVQTAFEAILKAEECDIKGDYKGKKKLKFRKDIGVFVTTELRASVVNDGIKAYNRQDYAVALSAFENALKLDQMESVVELSETKTAIMDTAILFNGAIAAYYDKQHEKAIELLSKTIEYGYGEKNPYLMLYTEYRDVKDTANMIRVLQEGFKKYPEEKIFINDLVVYYINSGNLDEGMGYIDEAIKQDPSNVGFIFAKGQFYDQQGNIDKAISCYNEVIDKSTDNETLYNANYNTGVIFFNKAVALKDSADAVPNNEYQLYKEKVEVANTAFEKVVPYFEKCVEIKPDDKATMVNLNSVYYRLIKKGDYKIKYEELKKKIDSL